MEKKVSGAKANVDAVLKDVIRYEKKSGGSESWIAEINQAMAAVSGLIEAARIVEQNRKYFLCGKAEYSADWINFNDALSNVATD